MSQTAMTATVELDKTEGITVTLENPSAQITSKIFFDGKKMVIEIVGSSDTASITLVPEQVTVKAKTITLEGEKITLTATDTITLTADKDISGAAKGKLDLKADQTTTVKGTQKLSLLSTEISGTGDSKIALASGPSSLELATTGTASLKATTLALEGSVKAGLKAVQVGVEASAQLELKSGALTAVKGAVVQVQGNMNMIG